jgi:large subunit ribosomal protein L25
MRAKQVDLTAQVRTEVGARAARTLRAAGRVPAVVYGRGRQPIPVSVEATAFARALPESAWRSTLISLQLEGLPAQRGKKKDSHPTVIIADVQRHPLRQDPSGILAIDFHQISLQETIKARVRVISIGESPGVKLGGVLEHIMHDVEVECLPTALPDRLEADVSGLDIGDTFRARDLKPISDVKILTHEDDVLLVVAPPAKVVEPEPVPTEVGAVVAETAEPELIGKEEGEQEE